MKNGYKKYSQPEHAFRLRWLPEDDTMCLVLVLASSSVVSAGPVLVHRAGFFKIYSYTIFERGMTIGGIPIDAIAEEM